MVVPMEGGHSQGMPAPGLGQSLHTEEDKRHSLVVVVLEHHKHHQVEAHPMGHHLLGDT